jgi:2-C-methyl-D-erythritol 4-phosphate cytidylyltransferase/2-C-methyl-D-erythritol 2,4-cyclodiphosphate synthase
MSAAAILLAAGRGERLGSDTPKAFADLEGRPLLLHALDVVRRSPEIATIVVTATPGWEGRVAALVGEGPVVVTGGETRQRSVAAAVAALTERKEPDVIVCHDVARPRATSRLFQAVIAALKDAEGAIPVIPIVDTLKRVKEGVVLETLSRDGLVRVQTPQAFRSEALVRAHRDADLGGESATDDAMLLERAGMRVAVVPGEADNIKITTSDDLRLAALLGRQRD